MGDLQKSKSRPKRKLRVLCICAAIALFSAFLWPSIRIRHRLGWDVWWTLQTADTVSVYRLNEAAIRGLNLEGMDWWSKAVGNPVTPPDEWARKMRGALLNAKHYDWQNRRKVCAPTPGVGMRFIKSGKEVVVLICFECDMISVAPAGQMHWMDFDRGSSPNYSEGRERYLQLVKQIFPADASIQSLK